MSTTAEGGPTTLEAEAVVVGSGPTGALAALKLARAGVDVLVVERGEWFDYAGVHPETPDFERRRAGPLHPNPNIRRAPADDPVDDRDSPIKPMTGSNVGGTSVYWSGHVPRFRPEDFRVHALDGVAADWPIAYEDLSPFYDEVEALWGVAGVSGDPSGAPWSGDRASMPTIGPAGRRVAGAFDRLGWHWWPVDVVLGREAMDPSAPGCDHVGPCHVGCVGRRRAGSDHAFLTEALAAGARLAAGLHAVELAHTPEGRVTRLVCRGSAGTIAVSADRFYLAANAMETARLLLLSRSGAFPEGLGNRSDLVGRNLMLHPGATVTGTFDERLGIWSSGRKAGIISMEFMQSRPELGLLRGTKLQLSPSPGPLGLALGGETGGPLPWGSAHHRAFEALFDRCCGIGLSVDDLPEPDNRISLSTEIFDRDGLPAPKMIYRLSEMSRRIIEHGMDRSEDVLREAGAHTVHRSPLKEQAGFHLMGTTRMGRDPDLSVVDPWGRVHGSDNLYVLDAGVFVTGSVMNPTLTAQALAARAVDASLSA